MHWKFSRPALLFLLASFTFGMGAAQLQLYLNFYLRALEVPVSLHGVINALPALALIVTALPGAALASRIGYAWILRLGGLLTLLGLVGVALSSTVPAIALSILLEGMGAALIGIAGAPFMAAHSNDQNRVPLFSLQLALLTGAGFLGNLIGGLIPRLYAESAGVAIGSAEAVRVALLCGAAFQLLSLLPTVFIPHTQAQRPQGKRFRLERPRRVVAFLLPNVLVGLGAGLTIPYLNVFIEGKFGTSFSELGALFAWTSLATAVTALIQPRLVRSLGEIRTVMLVQGVSLPFLALLGFGPTLALVSGALFIRGALMNASGPVYSAYTMRHLSETDRGIYAALNPMVWNVAWALGNLISGAVRSRLAFSDAFDVLFALTLALYAASVGVLYVVLGRRAIGQAAAATD